MPQILKTLLISISDRDSFRTSQKQTRAQLQCFPLALSVLMSIPSFSFAVSCPPCFISRLSHEPLRFRGEMYTQRHQVNLWATETTVIGYEVKDSF